MKQTRQEELNWSDFTNIELIITFFIFFISFQATKSYLVGLLMILIALIIHTISWYLIRSGVMRMKNLNKKEAIPKD